MGSESSKSDSNSSKSDSDSSSNSGEKGELEKMNDRIENPVDWWKEEKCYIVKDKDGNDYYQNSEWELPDFQKYSLDMLLTTDQQNRPLG